MSSLKVQFKGAQDIDLVGTLERPSGIVRSWAIFAHCFTCTQSSLAASRISRALSDAGIGVLRFDFAGLGGSSGDFANTGFSTNVEDLVRAANWMASEGRRVEVLIGHSLGGAASLVAAQNIESVKAVATLGAPADASNVIRQFGGYVDEILRNGEADVLLAGRPFKIKKSFLEDVGAAKTLNAIEKLRKPLLIMHSPVDETVGIQNATEIFVRAKHPKSFVSLDGADHLLSKAADAEYVADVIAGWAGRYLSIPMTKPMPAAESGIVVRETGAESPYENIVGAGRHSFLVDEPKSVGGGDTGPDPYAMLAASLGACTSMTLRMYAARKQWPVDRISVRLHHSKEHPADCEGCGPKDRIDVFTREIDVTGDLTQDQRNRLLEIADRCPVHRTLENGAEIRTSAAILSA